jgi:ribosomal protein S19
MKKNNLILNLINFLKNDIIQKNDFYLKVFDRNIKINENMVGLNFAVYNGKFFIPIRIRENMVGKILGSFSFSKNIILFNKNINRLHNNKKVIKKKK